MKKSETRWCLAMESRIQRYVQVGERHADLYLYSCMDICKEEIREGESKESNLVEGQTQKYRYSPLCFWIDQQGAITYE